MSADVHEVHALSQGILEAWNRRDAAAYGGAFAEDADVVGFDGSQMKGRAEITATLQQIFDHHPTGAYYGKVREVRLLGADAAVLRAVAGIVPAGQSDLNPQLNSIQGLVAIRQNGRWVAVLFQNTPAQFHGRPELVAQLTDELRLLLP